MKKARLLIIALALSACHEDDSTLATREISDIVIAALEGESAIAYSGHVLERQPEITTGYAEDQLHHAWYLERTGFTRDGQELIGSGKNLSYEVNLPTGTYTIVYEVSSRDNGYTVTATMTLTVTTEFGGGVGFWVFKETADGNTEIDLHAPGGPSMQNLMTKLEGAPLPGAPRAFSILYDLRYIDPANPLLAGNNHAIALFTENDEFRIFRVEDMARVFDRSNLLFSGPLEPGEIPYNIVRGYLGHYYFSSAGARYSANSGTSNGQMGFPAPAAPTTPGANVGASKHVQMTNGQTLDYWNEQRHRLESVNYTGTVVTEVPLDGLDAAVLDRSRVVAHGIVSVPRKMPFFLLQDGLTGDRHLVWLEDTGVPLAPPPYGIVPLDPALHLARADVISANGRTAQLIYCLHENKLWAYDIAARTERELALPAGIPAGARLSYVANLYDWVLVTGAFDYIVIGTQEGNDYALYCYSVLGGQPDKLQRTFRGEGRVEKLRYLSPVTELAGARWIILNPLYPMY
jgi:hypothetical protein